MPRYLARNMRFVALVETEPKRRRPGLRNLRMVEFSVHVARKVTFDAGPSVKKAVAWYCTVAPSSTFVGPEILRFVTLRYCATRVLSRRALKAMALWRPACEQRRSRAAIGRRTMWC